jgi:meso-butanediol dehydrogenase / (S,S)-butanediol dehydrogenase / diacetyl reductase
VRPPATSDGTIGRPASSHRRWPSPPSRAFSDSNSTPCSPRNSLAAAQLPQAGCQKRATLLTVRHDRRVADALRLDGSVAVVTGGASGIGEACRRLLEASGSTVHVVDRDGDPAFDVTDRAALDRLAASLERLDVLVNAAGVLTENRPVDELAAEDFRRNFEVNVLGTLNACQAFAGLLRATRGAVVNVASQAALVSLPQQAAYTASKGAVAALTRSLAIDWAEHGVRVNAVAPGFTVTPMTEAFFENETFTRAATGRIPLGRLLQADEIAAAIVFLASPLASAITGVVLPVDGGWTAGEPALPW